MKPKFICLIRLILLNTWIWIDVRRVFSLSKTDSTTNLKIGNIANSTFKSCLHLYAVDAVRLSLNFIYIYLKFFKLAGSNHKHNPQIESFINGRVIKAMNFNWHPDCFRCYSCSTLLIDSSFVKNGQRPYCKECNMKEKLRNSGNVVCSKCL